MNFKRFEFRQVNNNFGEQSIILEAVRYTGEWSVLKFNKKDNKYITNEITITIELCEFLIESQLISVVRANKSLCNSRYMHCVLQLTSKALIKTL